MRLWWLVAAVASLFSPRALKLALPAVSRPHAASHLSHRRHQQGNNVPPIGAVITVHPPKFPLLAKFIEAFAACAAAREVMSVFVVFWDESDRSAFERGLSSWAPNLTRDAWVAVVPPVPPDRLQNGNATQLTPAWKKWYGIAYLMDLGAAAPDYGLMLDAEVLLYNATDCGGDSQWHQLHGRIKQAEASKAWLAARVGTPGKSSQFGQTYDRAILVKQKNFLCTGSVWGTTVTRACGGDASAPPGTPVGDIDEQISDTLFSWWTDLPYVNLTVAEGLLESLAARKERVDPAYSHGRVPRFRGRYLEVAEAILWPHYEHLTYQAWCVLHHGYHFEDVTNLTGPCKWGSYNEDPRPGSRIGELEPMWVSASVARLAREAKIPPLSSARPPVLIFHVDHEQDLYPTGAWRDQWNRALNSR